MNHFEQIDQYLSGEMNAQEKALFEEQLRTDAALKKDFDEWVDTEAIVAKHEAAAMKLPALKNTLTPLTKEYFGTQKSKSSEGRVVSIKKYVYAAMAVAAVLIVFFLMPGSIDQYDVTPMPGAVVRGAEEDNKKGAQLFNKAKYSEALPYLKQNTVSNPDDATNNFYYGIALLKTEKPAEALPIFEKLSAGPSAYKEDSYFFAALAAYKTGKNDLASKYASTVPEGNQYYKNAKRILKKAR